MRIPAGRGCQRGADAGGVRVSCRSVCCWYGKPIRGWLIACSLLKHSGSTQYMAVPNLYVYTCHLGSLGSVYTGSRTWHLVTVVAAIAAAAAAELLGNL